MAFSSGWASAVKEKVFSEIVKSQKIYKPRNKSCSRSPHAHDLEDMQAMLAAKCFNPGLKASQMRACESFHHFRSIVPHVATCRCLVYF